MSVTDFECAIAKSQIARYIAGENLAPEVARQLETHIAACPRCKQLLQEKKSSLEAMIEDKTPIKIPTSDPIPMSRGNLALSPDILPEPEAPQETPQLSLRERIREQARILASQKEATIDVPAVAPAFAHKDTHQTTGIKVPLDESAAPAKKKKGLSLSSFALYQNIPDEPAPAMTKENLQAAKAALKTRGGLGKPVMYLMSLCVVITAMSYVVKDPTALFGSKAAKTNTVTDSKPVVPVAKKKAPKLTKLTSDGTTNAEKFAKTESTLAGDPATDPTPTPTQKAVIAKKPAVKPTDKTVGEDMAPAVKKPLVKKPAVKKPLVKKPLAKLKKPLAKKPLLKAHKAKPHTFVRLHKPTSPSKPKGNAVKLYAPESNSN